MTTTKGPGLSQRIRAAQSKEEIDHLLEEGKKYKYASPQTRRRWERCATCACKSIEKRAEKHKKERKEEPQEE